MSDKEDNTKNVNDEETESFGVEFPDAEEMGSLLGEGFEMPSITQTNEDSAPSAEPEPETDEDGESYERSEDAEDLPRSKETDAKGREFDPQLHSVDSNGNPRYNKKGLFIFLRKDKRGKVDTTEHTKAENFESALLYFDAFTDTAASFMGEHWKPTNDDQRKSVAKSIARYLDTTEHEPLTPRDAMLIKLGTYSAPRIVHKDTGKNLRLKIVSIWWGAKDFWATLTGKKRATTKPEPRPVAEEIKTDGININPNAM